MNFNMSDIFKKIQYWSNGRITLRDNEPIHNTSTNIIPKFSDSQYPVLSRENIHNSVSTEKTVVVAKDNKSSSSHQTTQILPNTAIESKVELNNYEESYMDTGQSGLVEQINMNFNLDYY